MDELSLDLLASQTKIRDIERVIIDLLTEIEEIEEVKAGINQQTTSRPAAVVTLGWFLRGEEATGGLVEYGWRWNVVLTFDNTADGAYDLHTFVIVAIQKKFQANPSLRDTCYRHELVDGGPGIPFDNRGEFVKAFEIVAEIEEEDEFG